MSAGIPGRATVMVSSDIAHLPFDNDRQQRTAAMPADASPERSARLSKNHPRYARTYTLLDQVLPGRVPSSPGTPPPSERLPVSLRANGILLNNFRLIWVIQPPAQKYSAFPPPQISGFFRAVPSRQEGRIARRHERGTGCGGRSSVRREACLQGGLSVSGHGAQDDRRCSVRQNRVVLAPVAGVKLPVANLIQPDRFSHQAGSDGGKTNSSPGRARHKPSNHCAGNAGVLRLYLYARVRSLCNIAHETAGAASTRHSLLPLVGGTRNSCKPRAQRAARTPTHIQLSSPAKAGDPVFQRQQ